MRRITEVLPRGWWSIELPGYRDHPQMSTYSLFSYAHLPPIPEPLDDAFSWLEGEPVEERNLAENTCAFESEFSLAEIAQVLDQSSIQLPALFVTFAESVSLHRRIRSCTDCYLQLPDYPAKVHAGDDYGFLINFLSDSQWCLHWYLYLNPAGEHLVLVSPQAYGFRSDEEVALQQTVVNLEDEPIWICAPSLNEFIYRFWIENEIWYALAWDERPLTEREQTYAEHYARFKNADTP